MNIDERLRGPLTELNEIILENTRENINMYEIGYHEYEDNLNYNFSDEIVLPSEENAEEKGWRLIDMTSVDEYAIDRLTTAPFCVELFMSMISFIQYNHQLQDFFTEYGHYLNIDKEDLRIIFSSLRRFKLGEYHYELCQKSELSFLRSLLIFSMELESFLVTENKKDGVNVKIKPILWTGTKEQLANVINTLVEHGQIPDGRQWQSFSEHFVICDPKTQELKKIEAKELSSIFNKTPSSRKSIKELNSALSNTLQSPQTTPQFNPVLTQYLPLLITLFY